jgi:flagella basal body P-ring formation protein FlgA
VQRVFRLAELRRMAAQWKVPAGAEREFCVVHPAAPVSAERVLEAMRRQAPGARVELLEYSHVPVPEGEIEFPLSGLHIGYWQGSVRYGVNHRYPLWARVKVTVSVQRVVAAADLIPGQALTAADLRMQTREEIPDSLTWPSMEELQERIPRRSIPAGSVLHREWFTAALQVHSGDTVKVTVTAGAAVIEAAGVAEASGALGDTIMVRNPESAHRFRARIEGKGKVSVKGTL